MAHRARIFASAATLLAGALLLTGCSPALEPDELPGYTVLQHPKEPFGKWKFSYLDSQGEDHPLDCVSPPFERRHCDSKDGIVSFEFTVYKSQPRIRTITVDGVERPMSRVQVSLPDVRRTWVPTDSLPAGS